MAETTHEALLRQIAQTQGLLEYFQGHRSQLDQAVSEAITRFEDATEPYILVVNSNTGNDTTGDGSTAKPYATIAQAISRARPSKATTIQVYGTYHPILRHWDIANRKITVEIRDQNTLIDQVLNEAGTDAAGFVHMDYDGYLNIQNSNWGGSAIVRTAHLPGAAPHINRYLVSRNASRIRLRLGRNIGLQLGNFSLAVTNYHRSEMNLVSIQRDLVTWHPDIGTDEPGYVLWIDGSALAALTTGGSTIPAYRPDGVTPNAWANLVRGILRGPEGAPRNILCDQVL